MVDFRHLFNKETLQNWRQKVLQMRQNLKSVSWQQTRQKIKLAWRKVKRFKLQKTNIYKKLKKICRKISDSWKILLICVPTFLFCYYIIGGKLAENIDVQTECQINDKHSPLFETGECMAFLIKREVDSKMWTPNLPPLFPAYVLDNMPHFQIGIISAVKDVVSVVQNFEQNTEPQQKQIKKAHKMLAYPPDVWLMSKKGEFKLAPSSNSQYRKGAALLREYVKSGVFSPEAHNLDMLLQKISINLQNMAAKNENRQLENYTMFADTEADDLFYFNRGYAFAMWQICKILGVDYRQNILDSDAYVEWTYLVSSLQKTAEFAPLAVRNGKFDSFFTPSHLLMQNYFLLRAVSAAEKIRNKLSKVENANKN